MTAASLILLLWTALAQGPVPTGGDDLTAAKTLYASGAYEEALARLSALTAAEHGDDVDQYRALCLLALGRAAETESSLQALIVRNPLFKMSEQDMSPRLVSLFHDVRKRVLPSTVKDLYGKAKTNYDQKQYSAASTQFTDLLKLLADEDLEAGAPAFSAQDWLLKTHAITSQDGRRH